MKIKIRKRPRVMLGTTLSVRTGCGDLYITLNTADPTPEDDSLLSEIFIRMGKAGGCASAQCEALGRLISNSLMFDIPLETIIDSLIGIQCHNAHNKDGIYSCAHAIADTLKQLTEDSEHA